MLGLPNPADYLPLILICCGTAWLWPKVARVLAERRDWGYLRTTAAIYLPIMAIIWLATLIFAAPIGATTVIVITLLLMRAMSACRQFFFQSL